MKILHTWPSCPRSILTQKRVLRLIGASFLSLIALVLAHSAALAQSATPADANKDQGLQSIGKRFEVGITLSPDLNYRHLRSTENGFSAGSVERRDELEIPSLGFTAGLHVGYRLSERFRLESGVFYANRGFQTKQVDSFWQPFDPGGDQALPEFNIPIDQFDGAKALLYRYHYVGMPLRLTAEFGSKRLRWIAGVGLIGEFMLSARQGIVSHPEDGDKNRFFQDQAGSFRDFALSPMLSIGVEYLLSPRLRLRGEGMMRYGLLSLREQPYAEHLYGLGFQFSLLYTF